MDNEKNRSKLHSYISRFASWEEHDWKCFISGLWKFIYQKLAGTKVFGSRITGISNGSNLQYNGTVAFTFLVTITLADGVTFCGARAHLKTIVISKIKRYYQ